MPRRAMIVLAATSVMLAAGCTADERDAGSAPTEPETATGYPVQVENCGRTLTFDEPPSRVVTGYQPVLEVVVGLGLADKVIGRTTYDGAVLPEQEAEIESIPIVSETNYLPPKEELLALAPDFVYSTGYADFEASAGQAGVEDLDAVGTQAYIGGGACSAEQADEATLQNTYDDVLAIGRIFGVPDRAEREVQRMKETVEQVRAAVADRPAVPVMFYSSGTGPLRLAGAGLNSEIIRLAGGENVFADQPVYFEANQEAILTSGAETFVISDYQPGATAQEKAAFLTESFPDLAADRDGSWPTIDAVYTHPGWRHAEAIAILARQLHPDAFD